MSTVIASTNQGEALPRHAARSLVVFVAVAALVLVAALVNGSTTVFNVVVFLLFAGLWLVLATALVIRPGVAAAVWRELRGRSMTVQVIVWLLFLPVTAALWLWSRPWPTALRATLIAALAFVNLMMFLPRR